MLTDKQAENKAARDIIRPLGVELEDMLFRLPKVLQRARRRCDDEVFELCHSIAETRSRFLNLEQAINEQDYAEQEGAL